jgi:hypothetical protein
VSKAIEIEIPVIVGSNGKWTAYGHDSLRNPAKDADWGFMAENLDSSTPTDKDPIWPNAEARFVVRATVFIPDDEPAIVAGAALETSQ